MVFRLRTYYRLLPHALFLSLIFMLVAVEGADEEKIAELNAKLDGINKEKLAVQKEIDAANKAFFKFQHDVVYTNDALKALYKKIKEIEKTLVEKRNELNTITQQLPELRKIKKDREEVYRKLRHLKERERLVRNEISALKMADQTIKKSD